MCGDACKSPDFLIFVAQAAWAIWILSITVAKIAAFGMASFLEHFTNWAWLAYGIFFLASLRLAGYGCGESVAAACFFPLYSIAWFVAAAVSILLFTNPDFITDLFDVMDPGLVITGNDIFHVHTVIALLFYGFLNQLVIWRGLRRLFEWVGDNSCLCITIIVYQVVGGALLFAGLYFLVLAVAYEESVNDVYGTDVSVALGTLVYAVFCTIVSGVPLLVLTCCYGLMDEPLRKRPEYVPTKRQRPYVINFDISSK